MHVWVISESEDGKNPFETKRLNRVAKNHPDITNYACHNISRLSANLSADTLMLDGNVITTPPDLVIAREVSVELYPQWMPVLRTLEQKGAFCINPPDAIELTANKLTMGNCLKAVGIPHPDFVVVAADTPYDELATRFGDPFVLKQVYGTHGEGVRLTTSADKYRDDMSDFLNNAPHIPVIAQEFIKTTFGRDIRIMVFGDQILASMERRATKEGEFRSNVRQGADTFAVEATPDMARVAITATKALGLHCGGVDLLFTETGFTVCEVNKAPGFKGLQKANPKINIAAVYLERCIDAYRRQKKFGATPLCTMEPA